MVEANAPQRPWRSRLLGGLGLILVGLTSVVSACGESANQLTPVELAFLIPENFDLTGSLTAGTTTGFVEFDLRRLRDDALITDPLNVLTLTQGRSEAQEALTDSLGNPVFVERAVVLLGNGLDQNEDGIADVPTPTSPPSPIQPMVPFQAPEGWQPSQTLAYTPGQTTVPLREPTQRFGVYASSITAFEARLAFAVRDVLGQVVLRETEVNFPAGPTQPVTVSISNATASPEAPIIVAICNQLTATLYVGLRSGNTTTLSVPTVSPPDTSLNGPTRYVAQAYQFDSIGNLLQVSDNPADPGNLSTLLLDGSEAGDGTAVLSLVNSEDSDQFTCAGDSLLNLPRIVEGFF